MIDSHAHIYDTQFDDDRAEMIERSRTAGITHLLLPAIDSSTHEAMERTVAEYPDYCTPMIGLHPTSVNENPQYINELEFVKKTLEAQPTGHYCAVGEIGLDLYWSREWWAEQREAFRFQVELALIHDLPIAVHIRDAWDELIPLIEEFVNRGLRGVFHSFSGTTEHIEAIDRCGEFYYGIGGVSTYKRNSVTPIIEQLPLEKMLLETDCPYLPPTPHRGKRNEPSYIPYICNNIATIKGVTPQTVAQTTTENCKRLFQLHSNQ